MPKPPSSMRKRGQKREVVFDPEARKAYLRGFSERKRQRRAYGLAMQRIKDRKAKIEQRAQEKKDDIERIEQAEQQKAVLLEEAMANAGRIKDGEDEDEDDESDHSADESEKKGEKERTVIDTKIYDDKTTESHWGGLVTVTTSVVDVGVDSDDENEDAKDKKSIDFEQRYAGNVQKYMDELKGNMPGKKREHQHHKRKGKNGASEMKGMGGSANLKIAQKVLAKSKEKKKPGAPASSKGKRGKKSRR